MLNRRDGVFLQVHVHSCGRSVDLNRTEGRVLRPDICVGGEHRMSMFLVVLQEKQTLFPGLCHLLPFTHIERQLFPFEESGLGDG